MYVYVETKYMTGENQVAKEKIQTHITHHAWRKITAPYTNLYSRGTKDPSVNGKTIHLKPVITIINN